MRRLMMALALLGAAVSAQSTREQYETIKAAVASSKYEFAMQSAADRAMPSGATRESLDRLVALADAEVEGARARVAKAAERLKNSRSKDPRYAAAVKEAEDAQGLAERTRGCLAISCRKWRERKDRDEAEEWRAKLREEHRRKDEEAAKAGEAARALRDAERQREAAEWKASVARLRGSLKIGLPVESIDRGLTFWSRSKTTIASGVVERWYSEELRLSLTFIDGKLTSWTESRG